MKTYPQDWLSGSTRCFEYAAESEAASGIARDLLGPEGPFQNNESLKTRLGSRFFLALTNADPASALKCLKATVGKWDRKTLLQLTDSRRNIVYALEKIAFWRDLFTDAARLLLALGEAENEGCANNASGMFVEIFSPGSGPIAHSEASPAERFPVLEEALKSKSKARRLLALRACDSALTSEFFSRTGSAEYQGLRKEPAFWVPKTYGELWDAYRRVWQLLSTQLPILPEDERETGINILLSHASAMARIPDLAATVVRTMRTTVEKGYATEKQVITALSHILSHDDSYVNGKGLSVDIRKQLEQLIDDLLGDNFPSRLQRYVGMNLLTDDFDENKNHLVHGHPQIQVLAQQAVETPSLLQSELRWLATTEAHNGYRFGEALGQEDNGFSLLPMLLEAQRNVPENASVYFLGGYFSALLNTDLERWEKQLETLSEDIILNVHIPELISYSGMTDAAGVSLLKLAQNGIINHKHFGILSSAKGLENLSVGVFEKWIEFLLESTETSAVAIALKLYHRYYILNKNEQVLPLDPTFQVLTHSSVLEEHQTDSMMTYHWTKIGKMFIHHHPTKALELVERMLVHFGKKGALFDVYSQTNSILTEMAKQAPVAVWKRVSNALEDSEDFWRTRAFEKWMRETDLSETKKGTGALTLIPPKNIWEWIDEDVEKRARSLARGCVPKTLAAAEWGDSLARKILVRYGNREDVRSALISNFFEGVTMGLKSENYQAKKQKLCRIKASEDNENVKQWVDEFVAILEVEITNAKMYEEREF